MSKYSGKCDFYDHIEIHGVDTILASDIYIGRNIIPLRFESEKDLIPYYPYLVAMAVYDKERNKPCIVLSNESFVDAEEEEGLTLALKYLLRYYNKCKRKHVPYDPNEAIQYIWGGHLNQPCYEVLAERVLQHGNKATIDGVHTSTHQYDRNLLYNEMINNGYHPFKAWDWVYHEFKYELINNE